MGKYLIVLEKSETGYSAYSPDVSGCIATDKTIEKTIASMKTALALHLRDMAEDGEALPAPRGIASYLEVGSNSQEEFFLPEGAVLLDPEVRAYFPDSEAVTRRYAV